MKIGPVCLNEPEVTLTVRERRSIGGVAEVLEKDVAGPDGGEAARSWKAAGTGGWACRWIDGVRTAGGKRAWA